MRPIKINKRLIPIFLLVAVSVLSGLGVLLSDSLEKPTQPEAGPDQTLEVAKTSIKPPPLTSEEESATLAVYITGAVKRSKVYYMHPGDRISDVLDRAGSSKNAHISSVNLAAEVCDAMHIYIPTKSEVSKSNFDPLELVSSYKSLEQEERESEMGGDPSRKAGVTTESGKVSQGASVNVNKASVAELEVLPGVGPATAEKIISERELNGPFISADDLLRVSGIGEKKLEQMRAFISL